MTAQLVYHEVLSLSITFFKLFKTFSTIHFTAHNRSAEGGIRTHVPFRTNGFQDRRVMTTSIPLQFTVVPDSFVRLPYYLYICQHYFLLFFIFFDTYFATLLFEYLTM